MTSLTFIALSLMFLFCGIHIGNRSCFKEMTRNFDIYLKWHEGHKSHNSFQNRVKPWMQDCFGEKISKDKAERNHRFIEEALELVQSLGCTATEAHQLVDYTFGRPEGEPQQEVGGVMVTLAALCLAAELDMHLAGEVELERILRPEVIAKIRRKQAMKPKFSPLPE